MLTLEQILKSANAFLDLEYTLPTGDELDTRVEFVNRAIRYASDTYRFAEFTEEIIHPAVSGATLPLPSNFRALEQAPASLDSSGYWTDYPEIRPKDRFAKTSSDKYCYKLGNPQGGYNLIFNNQGSSATLSIQYQRYPSGLATLTDVSELPDDTYVITQTEAYVLMSRGDEKFPLVQSQAQQELQNMIGRSNKQPSGGSGITPKKSSFVIGE